MQKTLRLRPTPFFTIHARSISSTSKASFFLNAYRNNADETDQSSSSARHLRMIMFGKPGAGKGTLSSRLVAKYDILSLSTGDLLRQHISERTDIGREAEEIVAQGGLLPDELVLKVVTSKLDSRLQNKHWILDGLPRTLGQAQLLQAHLKNQNMPLTLIVNLDVPDEVILGRISDRWVHLPSGRVYNTSYNPPKLDGRDDQTGEPLTRRPDDNPEIFARRLAEFYKSTSPLLDYYTTVASTPPSDIPSNPHLHPHQLTFPQPRPILKMRTLSGSTSDEIWPHLQYTVRAAFPALKKRSGSPVRHSLSDPFVVSGGPLLAGLSNQ